MFGAPNPGISCSVCGHIHAHSDESSVNLDRRYCGDCGVCLRNRHEDLDKTRTRTIVPFAPSGQS